MRQSLQILGMWIALVGVILCGCRDVPPLAEAEAARHTIRAWLECEECWDGELSAVVALGPDAVPVLAATLREGLSPASRAMLGRQLSERHASRIAYGERHPDATPRWLEEQFVAHHMANRDALYRSRSARALGRLGTSAAEKALREALGREQRPDVEQSIRAALEDLRPAEG